MKTPTMIVALVMSLLVLVLVLFLENKFAVENDQRPLWAVVTAYSSDTAETDSTPFIAASGERVKEGMIANNCLEFGRKIVIEGKEYEVLDRMNRRYGCEHFDLWMLDKRSALEFGRQRLLVYIKVDN